MRSAFVFKLHQLIVQVVVLDCEFFELLLKMFDLDFLSVHLRNVRTQPDFTFIMSDLVVFGLHLLFY